MTSRGSRANLSKFKRMKREESEVKGDANLVNAPGLAAPRWRRLDFMALFELGFEIFAIGLVNVVFVN